MLHSVTDWWFLATDRDVDVEDVSLLQLPGVGHTVGRHVVHRGGDALGEPLEVEEGGVGRLGLVLQTVNRQSCTITEMAPTTYDNCIADPISHLLTMGSTPV